MITKFFSYKAKIKDIEYKAENGQTYSNTAAISFYDENKKEIAFIELGFVDIEDIFKMIDNGESLNLQECYVENFSLKSYRKSRQLEKESVVKLVDFNAKNSFFESHLTNDFSFAFFDGKEVSFNNVHFINGSTSFNSAKFNDCDVDLSYCFFNNGNVEFTNAIFGKGLVTFKNTVFGEGTKDFQYVDFGDGELEFVNTEFGNGDIAFINTNFNDGNVSFKVSRFGNGRVAFHFSKFGGGDISFERTEFGNGSVDFRKVEFGKGKLNFNRSIFGEGELNFEGCGLEKGKLTFKKAQLGPGNKNFELLEFDKSDLIFESIDFGDGNVSFNNSKINLLSLKSCHLDNYFDLRVAKCNFIDLSDTIVRDIIDLQPYNFDVHIKHLNIEGMRLLGRIDIDWFKNNVIRIISTQKDATNKGIAEQFRILKENFGNIGQYSYEDEAYIQFKRYEMKSDFDEARKKGKVFEFFHYPVYGFKWLMFDKVGLYATSPARVLFSLLIIYLIFSTIHLASPYIFDTAINCIPEGATFAEKFTTTFYYSAITFLTIGYGDCSPVGFLRIIASIEGFFGVFMMSYFTVAFARKILR